MDAKELSIEEIRAIVLDMREQARDKRDQSRALHAANKHNRAFAIVGEAVVIEHWANRLAAMLPPEA